MDLWIIIVGSIAILILLLVFVLVITLLTFYDQSFKKKENVLDVNPTVKKGMSNIDTSSFKDEADQLTLEMKRAPHETLTLIDKRGLHLKGYLYQQNNSKDYFLVSHGFGGSALTDIPFTFPFVFTDRNNILGIDHQGCGDSEGEFLTYGLQEHEAILQWIDKLIELKGTDINIYLLGVSMGAATVLYTADKNLPKNVKCIIADCGYTSAYDEFHHILKDFMGMPDFPILPLFRQYVLKKDHMDIHYTNTECVAHSKVPILYLTGNADLFVPIEHSKANYQATCTKKKLVIFSDAPHAMSYRSDPERYKKEVYSFIKDCR